MGFCPRLYSSAWLFWELAILVLAATPLIANALATAGLEALDPVLTAVISGLTFVAVAAIVLIIVSMSSVLHRLYIHARAATGDGQAQYRFAQWLNRSGERDKSTKYFRMAALQGHRDAAYELAQRSSFTEQEKWYRVAAEDGHILAQAGLGDWYCLKLWDNSSPLYGADAADFNWAKSTWSHLNLTEAYKWYWIAAKQDEAIAMRRDKVAQLMNADQIAWAERLALQAAGQITRGGTSGAASSQMLPA